ncbi:MAG: adenylate/guanylate cyclase domain-containing protein, partial [Candidatus Cloacimonadaceae bacterium]|nr:adenylate/guanylate cyclase domain-containing protein [Candidatus Cloacimonadaceae bacterium]
MRKFIPEYVYEKYVSGEYTGYLQANVLQIDVIGFTKLTADAMNDDQDGAELIAEYLSNIFAEVIDLVHAHHGFISVFQGDGLVAVFPEDKSTSEDALHCARQIITHSKNVLWTGRNSSAIPTSICCSLSYGSLIWELIINPQKHTWFFYGDPLISTANAIELGLPDRVVCDEAFLKQAKLADKHTCYEPYQEYYIMSQLSVTPYQKSSHPPRFESSNTELAGFFPELSSTLQLKDEYRLTVCCFIQILDISKASMAINNTIRNAQKLQAYFNKIDIQNSNLCLMILFGAPLAMENALHRAVELALAII